MDMKQLITVARGDAPADLVLTNARIVNTFTGEIEEANVAIHDGIWDHLTTTGRLKSVPVRTRLCLKIRVPCMACLN